jgi:hypothetical protein
MNGIRKHKTPSYPLTVFDLGAEEITSLKRNGIRSTATLLERAKSASARKKLSLLLGFSERRLLQWANKADRLRVKGIGCDFAELLPDAGVETVRELTHRNPQNLAKRVAAAMAKRKLERPSPSEKVVQRWIAHARKLDLKITYD